MLTGLLARAVAATPDKTAIVDGSRRTSYAELESLAARFGAGLRDRGVGPSDCVAILLPNCLEFAVAFYACARLGAVCLPLNPQLGSGETRRLLADGQARVVVTQESFGALLAGAELPPPAEPIHGRALYLYTSGSTDTYKRVCCTQDNLYYEAYNFVETVGLGAAQTILCTIPLHHSYGLGNCLLDAIYAGSTLVLLENQAVESFASRSARMIQLIEQEEVRFYPGVPYQFGVLTSLDESLAYPLRQLTLCTSSGDALPRPTYDRFLARFGMLIRSLYGSTEAGSICLDTGRVGKIRFGSLGLPLKNVTIQVRDDDGRELPAQQEGQIWVKSPVLPPEGYDNRPELNAETFAQGYYRTGDVGAKDDRGYLMITGRKQSFVNVAGYKVDLGEVEEVLQNYPRIAEAAAIGVADPQFGTLLKAVVTPRGAGPEVAIRAYCREQLAPHKVPRLLEFRDHLPRSPIGKVLKNELGDAVDWFGTPDAPQPRGKMALQSFVLGQVALVLGSQASDVPRNQGFAELGMDSLSALELRARLEAAFRTALPALMTFDYPTVEALCRALEDLLAADGR